MIKAEQIAEILSVYKKHGWVLRRVLLSGAVEKELSGSDVFGEIKPKASKLDGLWFSRNSQGTLEAWELRHLSTVPYALVEVMERETENGLREEIFEDTETRMIDALSRKN